MTKLFFDTNKCCAYNGGMGNKLNELKIRHLMVDKRIHSLRQLSTEAGLSCNTVATILRRGSYSDKSVVAIASVLECDVEDLTHGG